jgi:MarR family transcriptional regulator, organic hydroperoxide resistance regulator
MADAAGVAHAVVVADGADAARGWDGADDFLEAFDSLTRAIRRARGASAIGDGQALTLSQYGLLQPLASTSDARIGELAVAAGITASTATRILDALERRGIVSRVRAAGDRRVVAVTLTPAGRAVLRRQDAWIRARERAFYAGLDGDERTFAPALLRKLADLIDGLATAGPAAD